MLVFLHILYYLEYISTMKEFYPLIITSIAGLGAMLGNIFLFINKKYKDIVLAIALGLSSSVMFFISVLELIPEGMFLIINKVNYVILIFYSLALLVVGYILVMFIDRKIDSNNNLYKIGILSAISLLIHNIPEGIICAVSSYSNLELGLKLSFMIMIHNITEGIAICLPVYYATNSKLKAILITLLSAMGEIFGALITMLFLKPFINNFMMYVILLITAGIMISLSMGKIFIEGLRINKILYFIIGIIVGFSIVIFTL